MTDLRAVLVAIAVAGCSATDKPCSPACTGDNVCIDGACENAFDREWTFTAIGAQVAATEPDGTQWDDDGSPPDPYATLVLDGMTVMQTRTVSDSFVASWNQTSQPVLLPQVNTFQVTVTDADPFSGDQILQCPDTAAPLTAEVLRDGLVCTGPGGSASFEFSPQ